MASDNITIAFDAEYKLYELDSIIDDLENLIKHPLAKKVLNGQRETIGKHQFRLVKLIWTLERDNASTKQRTTQG